MTKMQNVKDTIWAFYEAMENGDREHMADQFETLLHHYKRRGQLLKLKDDKVWDIMRKWSKDVERIKLEQYEKEHQKGSFKEDKERC